MRRIRVLVVDDSVVIRRVLREVLASDRGDRSCRGRREWPDCAGHDRATESGSDHAGYRDAGDGWAANALGLKERYSEIPVIMFSTLTQRGAMATLDALALGARDYVTKPEGNTVSSSIEKIRLDLLPKVKALCSYRLGAEESEANPQSARSRSRIRHESPSRLRWRSWQLERPRAGRTRWRK